MTYDSKILIENIKTNLLKENIDGATIDKIVKFAEKIWSLRLPIFNGLQFSEVINTKNEPLTIVLKSEIFNIDYDINITVVDDEFTLRDNRNTIYLKYDYKKGIRRFTTVYGDDVLYFNNDDKKIHMGVGSYMKNAVTKNAAWDYYYTVFENKNWYINFNTSVTVDESLLENIENCCMLMIDCAIYTHKKYIDKLEPTVRRR